MNSLHRWQIILENYKEFTLQKKNQTNETKFKIQKSTYKKLVVSIQ